MSTHCSYCLYPGNGSRCLQGALAGSGVCRALLAECSGTLSGAAAEEAERLLRALAQGGSLRQRQGLLSSPEVLLRLCDALSSTQAQGLLSRGEPSEQSMARLEVARQALQAAVTAIGAA